MHAKSKYKVALLGSHLPRQCGIATFTSDLNDALHAECSGIESFVVAVNDVGRRYIYCDRVRCQISEGEIESYRHAAEFINSSSVDVLCLQHEYGVYGGEAGSHVLALLRDLRMPIVTTLHTILATPNVSQRIVMNELIQLSERLVVMSQTGASLLSRVYQVPKSKIDLIPHGIHDVPANPNSKSSLGLQGQSVILTFGLLSPDKGIEYLIEALPAILARFPKTIYIVLGATHPHVKQVDGEAYRRNLESRAKQLGVASRVRFHDQFVSRNELREYLSAADIYVTPYLKPEQITSGTLAYALGAGKAVISTPYWYAEELLAGGRGILVPWRDSEAISANVIWLLANESERSAMQARATSYTKDMAWPKVAQQYRLCYEQAVSGYRESMGALASSSDCRTSAE